MSARVFQIQSEGLGRGEDKLDGLLMANFLRLFGESKEKPGTLVFLEYRGSPGLRRFPGSDHLKRLEEQGVEILTCTTCLEYFDLMDKLKIGKATTMVKSVQSLMNSDMVCL